jgi:hypothetical protein
MRDRRFDFRQLLLNDKVKLQWAGPTGTLSHCIGTLCDLSISGVRIKVDFPIQAQTPVGVTVRGKELRGKVQYCTRDQTKYLIGLELRPDSRGVIKPDL